MDLNDEHEMLWYTRIRGETRGPFDIEQLKALAARGRLGRFHEVSKDMESWKPAGSLPELFASEIPSAMLHAAQKKESVDSDFLSLTNDAPSRVQGNSVSPPQEQWFYYQDGVQQGPAPRGVLRELLSAGVLKRSDPIWRPGWDDWKSIQEAPEFRDSAPPDRSNTISQSWQRDSNLDANLGVAAVLSLVIPGAGQMYKGKVGAGFAWLIGTALGYACFLVPGLIIHVLCVFDAATSRPR